jgi:serine/threonine protein kinase
VAIRWAAPEAISERKYTTKSDVWSFGILLYEVYSFGKKPYEGWNNRRVLEELRGGFRLGKPMLCPSAIYELMVQTWHAVPDERPDFDTLRMELFSISRNVVADTRHSSVGKNKLFDKLNEKKEAMRGATSTTEFGDYSQTGAHRNRALGQSGPSGKFESTGQLRPVSSVGRLASMSGKQRHGSMKQAGSDKKKTSDGGVYRSALAKGAARIKEASYTALLGKDDNVIEASTVIADVPPVYQANGGNATLDPQDSHDGQIALVSAHPEEQHVSASLDLVDPPPTHDAALETDHQAHASQSQADCQGLFISFCLSFLIVFR